MRTSGLTAELSRRSRHCTEQPTPQRQPISALHCSVTGLFDVFVTVRIRLLNFHVFRALRGRVMERGNLDRTHKQFQWAGEAPAHYPATKVYRVPELP